MSLLNIITRFNAIEEILECMPIVDQAIFNEKIRDELVSITTALTQIENKLEITDVTRHNLDQVQQREHTLAKQLFPIYFQLNSMQP